MAFYWDAVVNPICNPGALATFEIISKLGLPLPERALYKPALDMPTSIRMKEISDYILASIEI